MTSSWVAWTTAGRWHHQLMGTSARCGDWAMCFCPDRHRLGGLHEEGRRKVICSGTVSHSQYSFYCIFNWHVHLRPYRHVVKRTPFLESFVQVHDPFLSLALIPSEAPFVSGSLKPNSLCSRNERNAIKSIQVIFQGPGPIVPFWHLASNQILLKHKIFILSLL